MTDDSWEAEFLSTRHVHNRGTRKSNGRGGKDHGAFDVKKTFGSYELKCPAADRIRSTQDNAATAEEEEEKTGKSNRKMNSKNKMKSKRRLNVSCMRIFRLTDDDSGLLGELVLPGVLEAGIILAATSKGLEELKARSENHNSNTEEDSTGSSKQEITSSDIAEEDRVESQSSSGGDGEDSETSSLSEDKERDRFRKFEKNSFRKPKFWLWWKGKVFTPASAAPRDTDPWAKVSGMGYVVFSGNTCRKFEATLTCEPLGWKDVALSGRKTG